MDDVAARSQQGVAPKQQMPEFTGHQEQFATGEAPHAGTVLEQELEQFVKRALGDIEAAVHVKLAELDLGVPYQLGGYFPVGNTNEAAFATTVAERPTSSVIKLNLKRTARHQLVQQAAENIFRPDHRMVPHLRYRGDIGLTAFNKAGFAYVRWHQLKLQPRP